jgi:hypothetical protein
MFYDILNGIIILLSLFNDGFDTYMINIIIFG